jgi:hypothetical protein
MHLLNLGIDHQPFERAECRTMEQALKECSSMKQLRQFALSRPKIIDEWRDVVEPVKNAVARRFRQLFLKDKIVEVARTEQSDDVTVLMDTIMEVCDDYSKKLRTQAELKKMPKLQFMLLDGISRQSTYLSEIRHTCERTVNTSGKAGAQIPQLPLGDNSPPWGDNAVCM